MLQSMKGMAAELGSEAQVIEACQRGDTEAFRVLFDWYKDRVYSLAFYFSGHGDSARDITQETFLKLFKNIHKFRGEANFTTWLYKLVLNMCRDEQRRRRRFLPFTEVPATDMRPRNSSEKDYLRQEVAEQVKVAVMKLKPKFRSPILLRYVEELSYEEIAGVLGLAPGTVASRLNRGLRILARNLRHLRSALEQGI